MELHHPNNEESKHKQFVHFMEVIQKHYKWLVVLNEQILKHKQLTKYSAQSLLSGYMRLCKKIQERIRLPKPKISDYLYIVGPDIMIGIFTLQYLLGKGEKLRSAGQLGQIGKILQFQHLSQQQIITVAVKFAKQIFPKQILQLQSSLDDELYRSDKQKKCLLEFHQWFVKSFSLQVAQDFVPDKKRRIFIISQYNFSEKAYENVKKYGKILIFFKSLKKKSKQVEKKIKDRQMKILELIDGEKKYVEGLNQYIQFVKNPIQQLNILNQAQKTKIFSSIVEIKDFHAQFSQALNEKYKNYHKYQTFGDLIKKNIPFFKLYVDYILNMNDGAGNDFIKLQKEHPQIEGICRKYMDEKQKKATDEIAQPTFRIARYEALFSQIIKKTSLQHPDYKPMVNAKQLFLKTISSVNNTVDKIVRITKFNQLQQEFRTQMSLFAPSREYLVEYEMQLIQGDKPESVTLYIFNDLVLIVSETRKIIKKILVDEKYNVKRMQDTKTYKNLIKVQSQGFIQLSGGNKEVNAKKTQQAFQSLYSISKSEEIDINNAIIQVEVLGTQEIGSTSFAKHTQYIIQVKYLELKKLLHLRFSDLQKIVHEMRICYNSDLGIQSEQTLKKNWFNNHKSKVIEDRKRVVEQILYKMFNHIVVKHQPSHLLKFLNMDVNFFLIARKSIQRQLKISNINSESLTKKQMKEALMILCATQVKLGRDIYHDSSQLQKQLVKKIIIKVTLMTGEERTVFVNQYTTVEDICNKVSKLIGLRTNRDFRLFHEIGKKQLRVLDNQQQIMRIFNLKQNEQQQNGILSGVIDGFRKIFSPQTNPKLLFKKYYFLPYDIQQSQFRKDLTRLKLLTYQIFAQIKEMKYQFTFDEYLLFLAMLIYIQNQGDLNKQIDNRIIHRIIPETIFKLKNYNEDQWIGKAKYHLQKIHSEIQKLVKYNTQQMKYNQVKIDTPSKMALYFGPKHLCSQIALNKIKTNPIYGSNLFYVQPHKSTYEQLITKNKKMAYNMWLAIKVQSLTLLTPASKQIQLQLHYKNIEKIDVYSQAIEFRMDSIQTQIYRLNTYQSFQISQLVKYNKALNSVLDQIKLPHKQSTLISKAKFYKQDLTAYRASQQNK